MINVAIKTTREGGKGRAGSMKLTVSRRDALKKKITKNDHTRVDRKEKTKRTETSGQKEARENTKTREHWKEEEVE